ncbi:MAG: hypothetical protein K2O29_11410, partial [Ruminococcus sp.]|nr:hypothetical protein [Ruminococcus sp.]
FISLSLFLNGCGYAKETYIKSQNVLPENEESDQSIPKESHYDSYIVYSVDDNMNIKEFNDAVRIIENRAINSCLSQYYDISSDYDSKTFCLNFDYVENWSEHFIETSTLPNSVEFKKGDSNSDELIMNKDNILDAYGLIYEIYDNWVIIIDFNEEGSKILADVTKEIAGTDTPLSLWVNNELIFAPLVSEAITDGRTVITGNFTQQNSEELAEQLRSEFLPYSISIKEYKLADKNSKR